MSDYTDRICLFSTNQQIELVIYWLFKLENSFYGVS